MTFEEYCISKKINPELFKADNQVLYNELKHQFIEISPASFTMQKLFLINKIRRKYQIASD